MEVDVDSERGAVDVIVRGEDGGEPRSRPPDKEAVTMQSTEQCGSAVHQDSPDPVSQTDERGK